MANLLKFQLKVFFQEPSETKKEIPTYVIPLEGNYVSLKIQQIGG